jgi:hypothetical protein
MTRRARKSTTAADLAAAIKADPHAPPGKVAKALDVSVDAVSRVRRELVTAGHAPVPPVAALRMSEPIDFDDRVLELHELVTDLAQENVRLRRLLRRATSTSNGKRAAE